MKSKTSFWNLTALKKDITRYAPVWGGYTILLLLILFALADTTAANMARDTLVILRGMPVLNLLYAGVCGAFLFMDLFNGRLCNALHAFPLRRESLLVTHIISGVLFSLIPNLLVSLLGCIILWDYAYVAFIWLAASTLQYLFFFGTAVLCATCAGNLIGMVALYGIFHFITVLVYAVAELLYQPLLYGIQFNADSFFFFFPVSQLSSFEYADYDVYHAVPDVFIFRGLVPKDWLYLGICAGVGVVCFVLAWLVYRRRQLESAGDLISLRQLSPLFLIICTVGAGTILYLFSEAFDGKSYIFLAVGMVIGYFAGKMLLSRTVKVFSKKSFIGLGVLAVVFAGSMWLTWLDPLGVTRYVPDIDKVKSATVVGADKGYYYAESYARSYSEPDNFSGYAITEQEELVHLQDFHRQLIQYRPGGSDGTLCDVKIYYTLTNGRTVARYYEVGCDSSLGIRAGKYFSDMHYVFGINDTAILYDIFEKAVLEVYTSELNVQVTLTDEQEIAGLLDAIAADCEAGVMAQNWAYHEDYSNGDYYVDFLADDTYILHTNWPAGRFNLRVWPDCTNTLAYLQKMIALHPEQ